MKTLRTPFRKGVDWPPRSVLVVPDKFRGTLTSGQAARAIATGLRRVWPEATISECGLADGGEGFARLLTQATGGAWHRVRTVNAVGSPCTGGWGLLGDGRTAVLDLASASGLEQLPARQRRPLRTSTYGTGLVLRRALGSGAKTVIVGLGGSATNDGGMGVAAALGWRFLDRAGEEIPLTGGGLVGLARIVPPESRPNATILAATDVTNPLFGRQGAAYRFSPQKGATPTEVRVLDKALRRLARIAGEDRGFNYENVEGAGAAGGCGYGFMTFLGARLRPGFDLFNEIAGLRERVAGHDLVVTGEGCLDATTLRGKAPYRVALLAGRLARPVWGVFGRSTLTAVPKSFDRIATLLPGAFAEPLPGPAREHAARLACAAEDLARAAR